MFEWAADDSHIDENPWAGLNATAIPTPRDRVLTNEEWWKDWDATFEDNLGAYVKFSMMSAKRIDNVASTKW